MVHVKKREIFKKKKKRQREENYYESYFIECLVCARHCSSCFASITSFNPHNNSKNFVLFSFPSKVAGA